MIDMNMYREMNPEQAKSLSQSDDLGQVAFDREEAPSETFLLLLQTTIHGFGFQDKKWSMVSAAQMLHVFCLPKYRDPDR